jgi:hypothetical protein
MWSFKKCPLVHGKACTSYQGCQMVYLNAKNITNGYILEVLGAENVGTLMASWNILSSFGIFCGHLADFVVIWHILWRLDILFNVLVCCTLKYRGPML